MVRLKSAGIAALLLGAACDGGTSESGFSPDPLREQRVAWVGVCGDGSALVVEPLAVAHHPELAQVREEDVLRGMFGLAEDVTLLRVHTCGASGLPAGSARLPDGGILAPLGNPPEELAPRDRLIWYAVARGGEGAWDGAVVGETHSYLLAGAGVGRDKPEYLDWIQDGRTTRLQRMDWNERERRSYLETAFPPQGTEEVPLQADSNG